MPSIEVRLQMLTALPVPPPPAPGTGVSLLRAIGLRNSASTRSALANGCTKQQVQDVLLLVAMYCGVPATIETTVLPQRSLVKLPAPVAIISVPDLTERDVQVALKGALLEVGRDRGVNEAILIVETMSVQSSRNPIAMLSIKHPLWIFAGRSACLLECR
jgi:Carboxymuconolactone decarboxylase family